MVLGGGGHKPGEADDTEACYQQLEAWARDTFDLESVGHRWSAQTT
ncbi:MAG TPA: hypothetical protein VMZ51_04445 [Acidimicrobiales bacterium]|nr:hypothetical protein [Acidimicrobiales bacterium]